MTFAVLGIQKLSLLRHSYIIKTNTLVGHADHNFI